MRRALLFALAAACSGDGPPGQAGEPGPSDSGSEPSAFAETFAQAPNDEVDVLFMVDDSGSMTEEQHALADGFDSFLANMETTGTDFHLGLVTSTLTSGDPHAGELVGDPPFLTSGDAGYAAAFEQRLVVGVDGSDYERGLGAVDLALSPALQAGHNGGFLRPEAQLLVVFVSDEDDCSDDDALDGQPPDACYTQPEKLHPVEDFVETWLNLKVDAAFVQAAAIVGVGDDCPSAHQGGRYLQAAQSTKGVVGDICDADWSPTLSDIGLHGSSLKTVFTLTYAAVLNEDFQVWVDHDGTDEEPPDVTADDVDVPQDATDGWTYDPAGPSIAFHGEAIPERGASILVSYDVDSGG